MLKTILRTYKKPLGSMTKKDMQEYIERLTNDKIRKKDGQPYSDTVKSDFKIFLKSYLKFRLPKKYVELTDWFDVRRKKRTPDTLTEKEIEVLLNNCKNVEQRFMICGLFDSGARIEEFLNIRVEDISEPTDNFPYYKINFKAEYSKTQGRDIGMYWKHSTSAIKDFLKTIDKSNPKAQLIAKTYNASRLFVSRFGKKVLGKRITHHLFRKSSATYFADKLNRQQLCIRYGWDFSSKMPDTYIKRAGVEEGKVKEVILNTDLTELRKENNELKTRVGLIKENNEKEITSLKEEHKKEKINTAKKLKEIENLVSIFYETAKQKPNTKIKDLRVILPKGLISEEQEII